MNVLFEDDGQLKAGTVLADHDASLQVEAASGKRAQDQGRQRAAALRRAVARRDARRGARSSPASSIRRSCGKSRATTNSASTSWRASTTARRRRRRSRPRSRCCCTRAPMHFYKRGKGRYRKAPEAALKAALASVERKQREAAQIDGVGRDAARGASCRTRSGRSSSMLLYRPDKNALEWKALSAACDARADESGRAARRLRRDSVDARVPLRPRSWSRRFRRASRSRRGARCRRCPSCRSRTCARSRSTTQRRPRSTTRSRCASLPNGNVEIGIHIAAPALAMPRGSALDAIARARLSTVYMPGRKITMLPDDVVDAFTLAAGEHASGAVAVRRDDAGRRAACATRRASIACRSSRTCASTRSARRSRTTCRRRPIRRGPRELRALWKLATAAVGGARQERHPAHRLQLLRRLGRRVAGGRAGARAHRPAAARLAARQARRRADDPRQQHVGTRCSPSAAPPGLYRTQSMGKVKMSTRPGEHQGLGLDALPVGELAAAPLQRPRQPAAAARGRRRRAAAVRRERRRALRRAGRLRGDLLAVRRVPGPDGALLVPALAAAGARHRDAGHGDPRHARPLRRAAARRCGCPTCRRSPPETPVRVAIGAIDLLNATLECRVAGRCQSA